MDNNVLNHLIEKINKSEKLKVEYGIQVPVSEFDRDQWSTINLIADRVKELQ